MHAPAGGACAAGAGPHVARPTGPQNVENPPLALRSSTKRGVSATNVEDLGASARFSTEWGWRAPGDPDLAFCRAMNEFETDQAAREASGGHPYGRYLEEFEVGAVYKHWPAKTVTEADDHLFCLITMNHHPLHINDVYAKQSQQGRNVVVGSLVYSLALGMSVSDVSGKAIANLATEELSHPAPVFHGDTLFCESEVLEVKESQSKPDRGTVRVHTRVLNQDGVLVAEFKRLVLVPRKQQG
jgi:acyl dehydratase